jgi:hypothetical protein
MPTIKTLKYLKGKHVTIYTTMTQSKVDSEGNMSEGTVGFNGILVDADKDNVYLGIISESGRIVVVDEYPRTSIICIRTEPPPPVVTEEIESEEVN